MKVDIQLDCRGQLCPVPILMTEEKIAHMKSGQVLEVAFTDPGAKPDLTAWCRATGNEVIDFNRKHIEFLATIRKK